MSDFWREDADANRRRNGWTYRISFISRVISNGSETHPHARIVTGDWRMRARHYAISRTHILYTRINRCLSILHASEDKINAYVRIYLNMGEYATIYVFKQVLRPWHILTFKSAWRYVSERIAEVSSNIFGFSIFFIKGQIEERQNVLRIWHHHFMNQ